MNKNRIIFTMVLFLSFALFLQCKKEAFKTNSESTPADFLTSKTFKKLNVEIQFMTGNQPTQAALDNLKTLIESRLNKPDGVNFSMTSISAQAKGTYSLSDVEKIEKANRTVNTSGSTLTAYFLFLDGDYSDNSGSSKVLGIAYTGSSMVIFEKTIKEFSGGIGKPATSTLESTVLNHEFGHIMGLVNFGTAMQTYHQDEPNGKHCNNTNCLMYYTAETSDIVSNILGGKIPDFDSNCLADLKAAGGK